MGRRGPSRSLFAALPPELRSTIRTNGYVQAQNGPDLDSLAVKRELIGSLTSDRGDNVHAMSVSSGSAQKLLRTQPASPSSDTSDEEGDDARPGEPPIAVIANNGDGDSSNGNNVVAGPSRQPLPTATAPTRSHSAGRAVKRRRVEGAWTGAVQTFASARTIKPQKRRKGKAVEMYNAYEGHPWDCTGLVERYTDWNQVPEDIKKYFGQRYLLFEEYDELPLLLDHTGWFSVTAQPVARHIAERCRCDVVVDAFCGIGGNAIEFAKTCERASGSGVHALKRRGLLNVLVIAIDNDLTRLRLARHNALQYGVADRIEFIHGSYLDWARAYTSQADKEAIDVIFLSPPWGGVDYLTISADPLPFPPTPDQSSSSSRTKTKTDFESEPIGNKYPLSAILPIPGDELFRLSAALTPNIAYYLPRNTNLSEVAQLARRLDPGEEGSGGSRSREWVEIEEEVVGEKVKAATAYFGGLVAV